MRGGYKRRIPRQLLPRFEVCDYTSRQIAQYDDRGTSSRYRDIAVHGTMKTFARTCRGGLIGRLAWRLDDTQSLAISLGEMGMVEYAMHLEHICISQSLPMAVRYKHREYLSVYSGVYCSDLGILTDTALRAGDVGYLEFINSVFKRLTAWDWGRVISSPIIRKNWEQVAWILNKMCDEACISPLAKLMNLTREEQEVLFGLLTDRTRVWLGPYGTIEMFQSVTQN